MFKAISEDKFFTMAKSIKNWETKNTPFLAWGKLEPCYTKKQVYEAILNTQKRKSAEEFWYRCALSDIKHELQKLEEQK